MPKLRKHSQIQQTPTDAEESQQSYTIQSKQGEESSSLLNVPLAKQKMKYTDRLALIKSFENRGKEKPTEAEQSNSTDNLNPDEEKKTSSMDIDGYVSKFKDDDDFSWTNSNGTLLKKKKPAIRVSNKFFSDCNFDELEELPAEQQELVVERRESKDALHLLAKVEKRAEGFKNRLDFKNCNQDRKFKDDIKHKLKSLEGCEVVDLLIEVPKVIASSKHADSALYLKNVKETNETAVAKQETENMHRDRKLFYDDLAKKMKLKKAETLTESALKQCFKKSRLDADDFIHDFTYNQQVYKDAQPKDQKKQTNQEQNSPALNIRSSLRQTQNDTKEFQQHQNNQQSKSDNELPSNNFKEEQNIAALQKETTQKEESHSIAALPKKKKRKPAKKGRKFNLKDLIQQQAQDSDDGCPHAKKGDSSDDEEQDGDLQSLIDDNVTLCEEEEEFAHRKFIKDMIEVEEKNFERLTKLMHEQRRQDDEQLKKRMNAAARRNTSKDKVEQHVEESNAQSNAKPPSEHSNNSISNSKNMEKLKQLEIDIGIAKPPTQQTTQISSRVTMSKNTINFDLLATMETTNLKKPISSGLKNIVKFKSKPKPMPKVKNSQ